jgi:hypothetical protein
LSFTTVDVNSQFGGQVIQVNAYGPESYYLYMSSAAVGQALMPGIYEVTTTSQRPDFSFTGGGRGCAGVGRFEIIEAVFDENGRATRFRANFEQHCDNLSQPGLFGEVSVIGPPEPRLELDFQVDDEIALNRAIGEVRMSGTVRCSLPTTVFAYGNLSQDALHFGLIGGEFVLNLECSPEPRRWSVGVRPELVPSYPRGFNRGAANVSFNAFAFDPNYYSDVLNVGEHPTFLIISND